MQKSHPQPSGFELFQWFIISVFDLFCGSWMTLGEGGRFGVEVILPSLVVYFLVASLGKTSVGSLDKVWVVEGKE